MSTTSLTQLKTNVRESLILLGFASSPQQAGLMVATAERRRGPLRAVPLQTAVDFVLRYGMANAPSPSGAVVAALAPAPTVPAMAPPALYTMAMTQQQRRLNQQAQLALLGGNYQQLLQRFPGHKTKGLSQAQIQALPVVQGKQYLKRKKQMQGSSTPSQCTICMESFQATETLKELPCGDIFHKECIEEWLKNTNRCPNCQLAVIKK
jgi:hypothetical protein